jgi:hypothetical protein
MSRTRRGIPILVLAALAIPGGCSDDDAPPPAGPNVFVEEFMGSIAGILSGIDPFAPLFLGAAGGCQPAPCLEGTMECAPDEGSFVYTFTACVIADAGITNPYEASMTGTLTYDGSPGAPSGSWEGILQPEGFNSFFLEIQFTADQVVTSVFEPFPPEGADPLAVCTTGVSTAAACCAFLDTACE